jgi:hypothetical protein
MKILKAFIKGRTKNMKKSEIAVAVFTMISAASIARAESFNVDFDKGLFRTVDFMETVKTSDISKADADNVVSIIPVPATTIDTLTPTLYKLSVPGLQRLKKEALSMHDLSKEFLQLINEEKTIVLYNEFNVLLVTPVGNDQHVILESNDRQLLEFLSKQETEVLQAGLQNRGKVKVCKTVIKTLWKWVKEAWVAYDITEEICSWEENDTTPTNTGNPGGSGTTYHTGMGENSNYVVNKHLK